MAWLHCIVRGALLSHAVDDAVPVEMCRVPISLAGAMGEMQSRGALDDVRSTRCRGRLASFLSLALSLPVSCSFVWVEIRR